MACISFYFRWFNNRWCNIRWSICLSIRKKCCNWNIGERYAYTISGEGGVFYDYRTTKDAWGMFKNYLGKKPTFFSYGFAVCGMIYSSIGIYNSIWGTPNYDKWIVF